jgi:lipid II:glycine glycyltransferase (peptidoglycan interpeptide bridge formation enzyme)
MLFANGKLNYHLSGSDRLYRSLAPTNLLLYKAALWGYENGMKTFHLGGGIGSHEDNLFKFKRAFYKGELRQFAIGRKKFLPDTYDELNNCRAGIPVSSFFPEYRRPAPQSEE